MTDQRRLILQVLSELKGHCTVEEVYEQIQDKSVNFNLATVYRNLNFFCELHLLVASDMGGGRIIYELAQAVPHHHLVCRTCGEIIQISNEEVQPFFKQLDEDHAYWIDMEHLVLFGLCPHCRSHKITGSSVPG